MHPELSIEMQYRARETLTDRECDFSGIDR